MPHSIRVLPIHSAHSCTASLRALRASIPAWQPLLPGLTWRGRCASVILTSPPLRAAEVRITTAPLRREKQEGCQPESRKEEHVVVRTVPMAVEGASKTSAGYRWKVHRAPRSARPWRWCWPCS